MGRIARVLAGFAVALLLTGCWEKMECPTCPTVELDWCIYRPDGTKRKCSEIFVLTGNE